ncbi:MAG: rhodanese-like domain-containing protein [Chloroflexota bacterium]
MSAAQNNPGGIPTISVAEAAKKQRDATPALLVDVREPNEHLELRAAGCAMLPLSQLETRFSELPKDQPLMLICHSGGRSSRATAFLMQQGFSDASNVAGGMLAWKQAGLPTRSGVLEPGEGDL